MMTTSEPAIRLDRIEKSYPYMGGRTWVLRDLTLEIAEGEFVSVMGPSGSGKSTLLHILGMFDSDFEGRYSLFGTRVDALKPKEVQELRKRTIGFVFQSYHLLDDLTAYENLEAPLSYRNLRKGEREAIVAETLDRFNIVGKKDLYPSQLSGGQQQLVAVARAIVASPRIILADEPTGNLHSDQGREIMQLFRKLNDEGVTIVQVTHSRENAGWGDRILELRDGWLAGERGTGAEPGRHTAAGHLQ
jgi:ABC-type lipoprotein export system ATPase subunit